jgi:uncharacterized protein YbdZ (MbtH family)
LTRLFAFSLVLSLGAGACGDSVATPSADAPVVADADAAARPDAPVCTSDVRAEFHIPTAAPAVIGPWDGAGAQFNGLVYAAISAQVGVTPQNVTAMEAKITAAHPQFVRIFFDANVLDDPDEMQSFVRVVSLAQQSGAVVNVTWAGGGTVNTESYMQAFSNMFVDLLQNRQLTAVKWITIQNEVNSTNITMSLYEKMYRLVDADLRAAGIRDRLKFMGGDLVGTVSPLGQTQQDWFNYMAAHMADLLDAYSVHIYWNYWDTAHMMTRLTEVRDIVAGLPAAGRKPVYLTEYGVRGQPSSTVPDPGVYSDGTPIGETVINASQHVWCSLQAANFGYRATSKWDAYFAKYDSGTQAYYMIGSPAQDWPLWPVYHAVHLLTATVPAGWNVVKVEGTASGKLVSAFAGPQGDWSVLLYNHSGAQQSFALSGLPPDTAFYVTAWSYGGGGLITQRGMQSTSESCTLSIAVPNGAAIALTTQAPQL